MEDGLGVKCVLFQSVLGDFGDNEDKSVDVAYRQRFGWLYMYVCVLCVNMGNVLSPQGSQRIYLATAPPTLRPLTLSTNHECEYDE